MSYQPSNPGDWGSSHPTSDLRTSSESLTTPDGCSLFLRGWITDSSSVLLILHGLGGHGGWYLDLSNSLAQQGITVYTMDHRGFGRSGGLPGHIDRYQTYTEDVAFLLRELRKRHPHANLYLLGHSMGTLFAIHTAARYGELLSGLILLNMWLEDTGHLPLPTVLGIISGGFFKSKRYWQVAGGSSGMTAHPDAIRMLESDTFWCKKQTSSFLFQILQMRLSAPRLLKQVRNPILVLQAEADAVVVIKTNLAAYHTLGSPDKTWKTYPSYYHDSQFEPDRSLLDHDIATWLLTHSPSTRASPSEETTESISPGD
jgi:alpha-beta hydrolase superfamily lysophospholipase